MTRDSADAVEVTQADRDAAADLYLDLDGLPYSPRDLAHADEIRRGEYDAHASVQAFARHRLSALSATPSTSDADTVAFVQDWLMNADYDPTKFDRDFARAIDDRVKAAVAATPSPSEAMVERLREGGEWREIEQETLRKGLRRSPKYYPAIGETCRMSGPNCDDADAYTWSEVDVLWRDNLFIVTRIAKCWPTTTKLELALFEPIAALTNEVKP